MTDKKKQPCAGCGEEMFENCEMKDGRKATGIGLSIRIDLTAAPTAPRHEPGTYEFCYSCWLESLGVKPNR